MGDLAIAFSQATDESPDAVLSSGQDAFGSLLGSASTIAVSTLVLLLVFKGLAWSISLGNFRGGPTFPALFLGVVGGLAAAHLPGYSEKPAVAALMGAMCVSILRLPLASLTIATLLSSQAGLATAPLIIVAQWSSPTSPRKGSPPTSIPEFGLRRAMTIKAPPPNRNPQPQADSGQLARLPWSGWEPGSTSTGRSRPRSAASRLVRTRSSPGGCEP